MRGVHLGSTSCRMLSRVAPKLLGRAASVRSFSSRDDLPGFDASRAATGAMTKPQAHRPLPGGQGLGLEAVWIGVVSRVYERRHRNIYHRVHVAPSAFLC